LEGDALKQSEEWPIERDDNLDDDDDTRAVVGEAVALDSQYQHDKVNVKRA
jgi:hypothetical protein